MISLSGAPKYSSARLLTYSMLPSDPALHTSVGIVSTSERNSCSLFVRATSVLLSSFDTGCFTSDLHLQQGTAAEPNRIVTGIELYRYLLMWGTPFPRSSFMGTPTTVSGHAL